MNSDYEKMQMAIEYLWENSPQKPNLTQLATFMNLSVSHCQKLFKKWAGISPKDFLQAITIARAKKLLKNDESLLETSLQLGLSSSSRLHDLFIKFEAMTPGEYKNSGQDIHISWGLYPTAFGEIALALTDKGICQLYFTDGGPQYFEERLKQSWPKAKIKRDDKKVEDYGAEINLRMKGEKKKVLKLNPKGSDFQIKIWQLLLSIPEGQVATYQKMAQAIGNPKASRAVGSAIAANPIGLLIPCHRVIRSTGVINQYHWMGVKGKKPCS